MRRRLSQSISRKLMAVVLATTFLALLVSAVAMLLYDVHAYRQTWISDLSTQADLLGRSSAPALQFNDPITARGNLALLKVSGSGEAEIAQLQPVPLRFSSADIVADRVMSAATTDFSQSLTRSLLSSLTLQVSALGLGLPSTAVILLMPCFFTSSMRSTECMGRNVRLTPSNSLLMRSSLGSRTTLERSPNSSSSTSMNPNRSPWLTWRA